MYQLTIACEQDHPACHLLDCEFRDGDLCGSPNFPIIGKQICSIAIAE